MKNLRKWQANTTTTTSIVNVAHTDRQIKGLEFVFIELHKFKPDNRAEQKLHELWLRFLTEIDENTEEAPNELMLQTETQEAIHYMEIGAYTREQLQIYDNTKISIITAQSFIDDAEEKGLAKGLEQGKEEHQKLQQELSDKDRRIAELEKLLTNKN